MSEFNCNDPAGMLGDIEAFPEQIEAAWSAVNELPIPEGFVDDVRQVLLIGMGGSAIGGDLAAGLAQREGRVPVTVHRDYGVPGWVDRHTLVVASSYSGNTEETLDSWDAAVSAGANCVAVTTGGALAERARAAEAPLLEFHCEAQPRAALGYSFTLIYGLLARLSLIENAEAEFANAIEYLRKADTAWGVEVGAEQNPAKQLAMDCRHALPVILGAEHLTVVARRWTTQINENAKSWAFWCELPEVNHNLIAGLGRPDARERLLVINLRSGLYHGRVRKRLDVTNELLDKAAVDRRDVAGPGGSSRLAELFWMVWLGDYVSYYLACLYGVDPSPVEAIDYLKGKLAGN